MIIRRLKEEDRNNYRKLIRYAFGTNLNNYENLDWPKDSVPIENFWGAFIEDQLVAGSAIMPFEIKFRGGIFKMWGVAGVASKPENRNRGAIKEIFLQKYKDMKDAGIPISVLYPFKYSYYENLGYYLVDEDVLYQFPITSIKKKETSYRMKEVEEVTEEIKSVYIKACEKFDYIANRAEFNWKRNSVGNYKFICYNTSEEPVGYLFLHFPNLRSEIPEVLEDKFHTIFVQEVFWLDSEAKSTIFNFFWTHRDQFRYIAGRFPIDENIIDLLDSPRCKVRSIIPNSQLRIIDVKPVMEDITYPIPDFSFSVRIIDKECGWNNGIFDVSSTNHKVTCTFKEESKDDFDMEISIGHLSQLIAGFRTINELKEMNLIKIKEDQINNLNDLFPKTRNYFRDFF
jgi:predicted acetyltransferase